MFEKNFHKYTFKFDDIQNGDFLSKNILFLRAINYIQASRINFVENYIGNKIIIITSCRQ